MAESRVFAPEEAASTDGLTRSMCAMALFDSAKAEYAKLAPDAPAEARSTLHRKYAEQAFTFASTHGGIYIKAAQFVASLQGGAGEAGVPREYVEALKPLTDRVPPRHFSAVAPIVQEEFGKPIDELVDSIEEWPVAAASLAQVHRAVMSSSGAATARPVALKLQYPTLKEQMAADFPGSFDGYTLTVVESHQATKVDTSGTAKALSADLATLTGAPFTNEQIEKVRDRDAQLAGGGPSHSGVSPVPEAALDGHAFHTYSLTSADGKVEFQFRHNVQGRTTYAEGHARHGWTDLDRRLQYNERLARARALHEQKRKVSSNARNGEIDHFEGGQHVRTTHAA